MSLDQYYTNREVARECFNIIEERYDLAPYVCLEPSAGTGAFYSLMPEPRLGFDLDPRFPGVVEQDFLTVELPTDRPVFVIGNPPFGKNASLALKFFQHCAKTAEVIAFILPRTFRKASMINRLDRRFHIVHDAVMPKDSFVFEGEAYDVPCVFQIWERRDTMRDLIAVETTHPDFQFTTADRANFAFQRVGVNAGTIKTNLAVSQQSHYFIKGPIDVFNKLDFSEVKHNTAGNPSIAKSEIVAKYREYCAADPRGGKIA